MNTQKFIVEKFVEENHSNIFKNFFDNNTHLCSDQRDEHYHRNIHFTDIKDVKVKDYLTYYQTKLKYFIDHYFSDNVNVWNEPRLCRWSEGESMALHGDNENGVDKMRYSALIYLNDDYEGGELRFENNKIYKLSKNSVIFFQSGIQNRHEVLKITKGLRYTIPLWYQ